MNNIKCSQCNEEKICSTIHIINTDDSEENFFAYCDDCLLILFHRNHRQMVMSDYIKGIEMAMDDMAVNKIDMGKPN